jgi:Tfp pilus assembly protein PilF
MTATNRADHRRPLAALLFALTVASLATLLPVAPAQAETSAIAAEAVRQLEFAHEELDAGHFERARKSASSALRLDPGLYEAMMVQGLALEGAGNAVLAEALLRTYVELLGADALPEARQALTRMTGETTDEQTPALARIADAG